MRAGRAGADMEELSAREERDDQPSGATGALLQALAALTTRAESVKPPSYHGEADVELFVQQFNDVSQSNGWFDRQALLHVRAQLPGTAATCGSGQDVEEVIAALRARFGQTERQTRDQLKRIKQEHTKSLHEQAWSIPRLVEVAYPHMSEKEG